MVLSVLGWLRPAKDRLSSLVTPAGWGHRSILILGPGEGIQWDTHMCVSARSALELVTTINWSGHSARSAPCKLFVAKRSATAQWWARSSMVKFGGLSVWTPLGCASH